MSIKSLEGLIVVALEQAVVAPYCTSWLADAGVRVIKIERHEGDFARNCDAAVHGESSDFVWINREKVSLFGSAAEFMAVPYLQARYGKGVPDRLGLRHPTIKPYGGLPKFANNECLTENREELETLTKYASINSVEEFIKHPQIRTRPIQVNGYKVEVSALSKSFDLDDTEFESASTLGQHNYLVGNAQSP